jgi:hypothetical protein
LESLFDGGIFGSPKSKFDIIAHELMAGNILKPALMLGDSKLDHDVASFFGLDFVFVSDWTEFREWQTFVLDNKVQSFTSVKNALIAYRSLND